MATVGCRKVSRARFTFISCWDRFGDVNNDPREKIGLFAEKRRAVPGGGIGKAGCVPAGRNKMGNRDVQAVNRKSAISEQAL